MQNEEGLVQRARQGDRQAFAALYEEHFDRIYRYIALRIEDRMEAEDMTQQVFLKALQSIHSYSMKGVPFSSWLYRIAHNQMVDHIRKVKARATFILDDEDRTAGEGNPESMVERSFDIERLLKAVKHLTDAQREVVSLRFVAEQPIAEVARIMGKSEGAIKSLQHSAIEALRRNMQVNADERSRTA